MKMSIDRRKFYADGAGRLLILCLACVVIQFRCVSCASSVPDRLPSESIVSLWAQNLSASISREFDEYSHYNDLLQTYKDSGFATETIDGNALLKVVAGKWEKMLELKMTAVENIVNKIEAAAENYKYNPNVRLEDVKFVNSKNFTKDNITVVYNPLFLSDVNMNFSSIQIPTDIYEGDPEILNSILSSDPVDSVFRENAKTDPQLIWQYFGSAKGFYRSYPAQQWVSSEGFDEYDVRRRGWYIQATSSPKNVMILIDTSGSTYGMTLEIMKVSVSKALDTLGNDDYVMVAQFNNTNHTVGCFNTFVQANLRNKQLLKDRVQELHSSGQVDFENVFRFAFSQFEDFMKTERMHERGQNQGANCIRTIMIFTDGGTQMARSLLEEKNRPHWVRIFVYNVGTDSMVPSDGVQSMACENKGFYSNIRSFGAVRLTTLDYVPVLSRPMVLSKEKNFQWSDIYLDALGLGMMTTLTRPVYNTTKNGSEVNEQLLGVVGTDITTKNMAETVPQRKPHYEPLFQQDIGPEGYAFGINTNGYILLHPRLKAEQIEQLSKSLGYLSDPPNVDFLEVEFEDPKKVQLRKDMINGLTGDETFQTSVMSNDERYIEVLEMTYSYRNINGTTFSVALAQPFFDIIQYAPQLTKEEENSANSALSPEHQDDLVLIAPWLFCESLDKGTVPTSTEVFQSVRKGNTVNDKCNQEAINKLWGDAIASRSWFGKFNVTNPFPNFTPMGYKAVFMATQGGLSRFIPASYFTEADERIRQDSWEQGYYRRPLYKPGILIFSVPYNDGKGANKEVPEDITVSKAIYVNRNLAPAVVGAILDAKVFDDFWMARTTAAENGFTGEFCYNTTDRSHCYLLDDGGFIIATSLLEKKSDVGRFFGVVDGIVMESMVAKGAYDKRESFDFQAACPYMAETISAGRISAFVPAFADIMKFNWWIISSVWTFVTHTIVDFLVFGLHEPHIASAQMTPANNVSCIKLQKQFSFGPTANGSTGVETCLIDKTECDRRWFVSRIPGTNLLIVAVNAICDGPDCTKILKQEPEIPTPESTNPCIDARTPRYRKRPPEKCYDFHAEESDRCTSGVARILPGTLSKISACLLVAAVRMLSQM